MFEKLHDVEKRFQKIEQLLSDPKIIQDREAYQKYGREHADLHKVVISKSEFRNR
jgi:peptide chain release factor 1